MPPTLPPLLHTTLAGPIYVLALDTASIGLHCAFEFEDRGDKEGKATFLHACEAIRLGLHKQAQAREEARSLLG